MDKKVLLIILDGYGEGKDYEGNAITRSQASFVDQMRDKYPWTLLKTDGESVGLPAGTMGGSEVGHFTMGCGRVVFQSLEMINRTIKDESFFQKTEFLKAIENCKKNNSKLHLIGMISDAGVHSHIDHLYALLKLAKDHDLTEVYIHAISDGRDVPEKSVKKYLKAVQEKTKEIGIGKLATLIGRYYSMDRDKNWDRIQTGYELYTKGVGAQASDPLEAIDNAYQEGAETDYYLPAILLDESGLIGSEDSIINFNYRSDRAAQITTAFTDPQFAEFPTEVKPYYVCFGPYSKIAPVVFKPQKVSNNLGQIISELGEKQLRIAETEKYPHVTFFFNSQVKEPYPGENRLVVDSPKVASYAEKPEMSAKELTKKLVDAMNNTSYKFIVLNYANPDLVGHSGELEPTKESVEVVNECLKQVVELAQSQEYEVIITADHGNAEYMIYEENGDPCPSHTHNKVIFTLVSDTYANAQLRTADSQPEPGLYDIAPTILDIMGVEKPKEMTGESLIKQS